MSKGVTWQEMAKAGRKVKAVIMVRDNSGWPIMKAKETVDKYLKDIKDAKEKADG